jgi:hypothetical protein
MLAGHYSTALVAYQKFPKGTLIFFLIASQFQDLVWLTLHYLGVESTKPTNVEDVTLQGLDVNMFFSHDLLPQLFWILTISIIGRLLFKSTKIGITGGLLVLGHFVLDFLSGYPHHIFGEETHTVGLGLYHSNTYLAIAIEGLVSALALFYFFKKEKEKGIERTTKNKISIIGLFVFGVVFLLLIATTSFKELFGLPDLNMMFNTTMPTLVLTYLGMIVYLNYFVTKKTTHKQ